MQDFNKVSTIPLAISVVSGAIGIGFILERVLGGLIDSLPFVGVSLISYLVFFSLSSKEGLSGLFNRGKGEPLTGKEDFQTTEQTQTILDQLKKKKQGIDYE